MSREKFFESDLIEGTGVEGKRKKKKDLEASGEMEEQREEREEEQHPRDEKKKEYKKLTFKNESDANIFDSTRK